MPVDLADVCPEDVEQLIVAWLTPLRRTSAERRPGDPLPFTLVVHIAGSENVDEGTAEHIVSVHTLVDKNLGLVVLADESEKTNRRMIRLAQHIDTISLVNTRMVNIDYLNILESPRREYYSDTILRKCGRYAVGLTYTPNIP